MRGVWQYGNIREWRKVLEMVVGMVTPGWEGRGEREEVEPAWLEGNTFTPIILSKRDSGKGQDIRKMWSLRVQEMLEEYPSHSELHGRGARLLCPARAQPTHKATNCEQTFQ